MIDSDGFRPNVGIIVANDLGQVLWARRVGQDAWQFPQGGINTGESPEEAFVRSHDRRSWNYRLASYRTVSTGLDFAILDTTARDGFQSTFTLTWRR